MIALASCRYVKNQTSVYGTKVAISEMQYGYTVQGNSSVVFDAIDAVHASEPFFELRLLNYFLSLPAFLVEVSETLRTSLLTVSTRVFHLDVLPFFAPDAHVLLPSLPAHSSGHSR